MGNKQSSEEPAPLTAAEHGFGVGDRVQTQWTVEEGGNDQWYPGTVSVALRANIHAVPPSRAHSCPILSAHGNTHILLLLPSISFNSQAIRPPQIVKVLKDGQCKIKYDDGDKWTGDARYIMRLTGSAPTVSTIVQAVPDGPVLTATPSIPQATVVPAQAVAVDASVVAK